MNHRYKKKPVVIEAFQMTQDRRGNNSEWPAWLSEAWNVDAGEQGALWPADGTNSDGTDPLIIGTLEGNHLVSFGDWIIQGVKGEIYPCKPDIFAITYEHE